MIFRVRPALLLNDNVDPSVHLTLNCEHSLIIATIIGEKIAFVPAADVLPNFGRLHSIDEQIL
jgi:hypothetical protein